ncbi:MAG: DoxX family protein [Rubripirellula sp.]
MSKSNIVGWVLSVLLAAFLTIGSASGKFTQWEGKAEMFGHLGWDEGVMFNVGIVEVVIAIIFLIPRTGFIGAILLTAYLGGATATHVRVGDPFFAPIVIAVVMWVALGLRDSRVFQMVVQPPTKPKSVDQ